MLVQMNANSARTLKYVLAAALVVAAFLSSYSFAVARGRASRTPVAGPVQAATPAPVASGGGAGCACCGGGQTRTVAGKAVVEGGVQRIAIDTSTGQYQPNEVALQAGMPAVLTFGEGQGCLAQVVFPELGIKKDLTDGGATVELSPLKPGEYSFACGMNMVFGRLVVR